MTDCNPAPILTFLNLGYKSQYAAGVKNDHIGDIGATICICPRGTPLNPVSGNC